MKATIRLEDDGQEGLSFDLSPVETEGRTVREILEDLCGKYDRIEKICEEIAKKLSQTC